ncbi:MAG: hypothetical protein FJY92_09310 [Candidatus Hydrogenedentes bacterium]|nr:hypothetical protein [Candidatus Hydrogenedentota bacterium]
MKHIPAAIAAETARRRVERSFAFRLDALASAVWPSFRRPLSPSRPLPFLELVWMPQYLMTFGMHGVRGPETACVTVDAYSGQFALFFAQAQVRDGDPDGERPTPELAQERAESIARANAHKWLLRYHRARKLTIGAVEAIDVLRYPFWVYYYQRRRGLLDVKIVDAVTGELPGSKTKYGIVRAFERLAQRPA